jgi:hypothetical protein
MTLFETWPHNWFGLWKDSKADLFELPLFTDVVDPSWNPGDLALLVRYLTECPVAIASPAKPVPCPMCDETLREPGSQRSDGLWVWPSSLAHFVNRHHVRLPDRLVARIREHGYEIPAAVSVPEGNG